MLKPTTGVFACVVLSMLMASCSKAPKGSSTSPPEQAKRFPVEWLGSPDLPPPSAGRVMEAAPGHT